MCMAVWKQMQPSEWVKGIVFLFKESLRLRCILFLAYSTVLCPVHPHQRTCPEEICFPSK